MPIEGILEKGFVTTTLDSVINWARNGSMWPQSANRQFFASSPMSANVSSRPSLTPSMPTSRMPGMSIRRAPPSSTTS